MQNLQKIIDEISEPSLYNHIHAFFCEVKQKHGQN